MAGQTSAERLTEVAAKSRLRKRDRIGLVFAAALLASLVTTTFLLAQQQQNRGHDELAVRFTTRAELAGSFVTQYIEDLAEREIARANMELSAPAHQQTAFETVVDRFEFDAAVLLDSSGHLLQVWPERPEILGAPLSDAYRHLAAAEAGAIGVSDVVSAASDGRPVVAVAVPFDSASGRMVFSGAFSVDGTPLDAYFDAAVPTTGGRAYVVDSADRQIVGGVSPAVSLRVTPELTTVEIATLPRGFGSYVQDDVSYVYARTAVEGTTWDVILTTTSEGLFSPVDGDDWQPKVVLGALAFASLIGLLMLVRTVRARSFAHAAALASAEQAAMESLYVAEHTEAARDAALSETVVQQNFAASASHELRTPTTSILGYVEEVLASDTLSEEDRGFLDIVYRNAQRLSNLIDDLLVLGEVEIGRTAMVLEPTDLAALMDDVVATFTATAQRGGVGIVVEHDEVLPMARVDPTRTEQALANLVSNAVKFTRPGGQVRVVVRAGHAGAAIDGHVADSVEVIVSDTGIGIEADELDRIFERFHRTTTAVDMAVKGTGLGLAIAKAMIEAQGGCLTVTSEPGHGTTFVAELPAETSALQLA